MLNQTLIDSGFLYALFDHDDRYHQAVLEVQESETAQGLVPDIVLVETTFLARRAGGVPAMVRFLADFEATDFHLIPLTRPDLGRAREILDTYASARLDFVDACLMALSERLDIRRVCTIDSTDFRIFRPQHCDHLEILPGTFPR